MQSKSAREDSEEEKDYGPKTIREAVDLFFENLSDNDFRIISETDPGGLPWLYKNYGPTVTRLCGLSHNEALYRSMGLIETTNPEDVIRIVIEAAWKQIHF